MSNLNTESNTEQVMNTESVIEQEQKPKEDLITLTKPELDKKITGAVFTALKRKEEEFQKQQAEKDGNYQLLFTQTQRELEELKQEKVKAEMRNEITRIASEHKVTDFIDILETLPNLEAVQVAVERINKSVNAKLEMQIQERLTTPNLTKSSIASNAPVNFETMTAEQWKEYKKNNIK